MSRPRPQGHRKSQSTSALSFLASQGQLSSIPSTPSSSSSSSSSRHRDEHRLQKRRSHLPSVEEGSSASASMSVLPGLNAPPLPVSTQYRSGSGTGAYSAESTNMSGPGTPSSEGMRRTRSAQTNNDEKMSREKSSSTGVEEWLDDLRSLRSSSRRRLAALKGLEKTLVEACISHGHRRGSKSLEELVSHRLHQPLLSLLTRHTSTLSLRASSTAIPANDNLAVSLIPELTIVVGMIQGLCLLSKGCKDVVGDSWVMEMFIDLLLLLRAQPAMSEEQKPVAYTIMELLFCVLVDSPRNARTFEKLSGLEAVVRVLKGTGVTKEVRMKCIEFLYFYLLPEQNEAKRVVSSSSSSSSSSTDSQLYPPSPLSTSQNSLLTVRTADSNGRLTPSPEPNPRKDHLSDVDMPFVPMTPRKPPQPNLGYLTPATRKSSVCTSTCSTPSLATVPASPRMPDSSTARGLSAMLDEMEESSAPTPRSSRPSRGPNENEERSGVGLGLGLPKSSSGLVRSSTIQRDLSGQTTQTDHTSSFTDPFNLTANSERSHSGSSGSSTVVPGTRAMSRSNTQPSLNANGLPRQPSSVSSAGTMRRTSVRRVSKSPLVQSSLPEHEEVNPAMPRTPKIRHSRTQSHLSALSGAVPPPPVPALPIITPSAEKMSRTPSKPRAFPAELTRGLPPSASSPSLSVTHESSHGLIPLGASKRIPSDKRPPPPSVSGKKEVMEKAKMRMDDVKRKKDVKSVEEKKEMLGMWLGNVDQLVQGVEKVSFWGSIGNGARGGR
ncbi:hypothetical protein IAU59_002979 [Kwoniella sp. CBS 9459]